MKTKGSESNQWLLIKSGEDLKPVSKVQDDKSILTGRTMARIALDRDAQWKPKSSTPKKPAKTRKRSEGKELKFIDPMKATLVDAPPTKGEWLYEVKFDGYRALALKSGGNVQLLSRNEKDFALRFPEITEAIARLPADNVIIDGEIVAMDSQGRPSFQLLQAFQLGTERPALAFYLFDLLHCEGNDLTAEPLHERRRQLELLSKGLAEPVRFSASLSGEPQRLLEEVSRLGLEGVIGKERNSPYQGGQRTKTWIKLKCVREQEFVIGGYTPPDGARKHFGALLLGVFEGAKLRFVGKAGTGFNSAILRSLHRAMKEIEQGNCPFDDLPEKKAGRWSQNITPAEMKLCHWVRPDLVCQIRFTEWTNDGKLRHPVFLGLREDKDPRDVVRETPSKIR